MGCVVSSGLVATCLQDSVAIISPPPTPSSLFIVTIILSSNHSSFSRQHGDPLWTGPSVRHPSGHGGYRGFATLQIALNQTVVGGKQDR